MGKVYQRNGHDLEVKKSTAGFGLFTQTPIKRGETVIEYTGEIITQEEANRRGGKYLFEINSRKTIDGKGRDNIARYINHSCRPNCEPEIRKGRVFIEARRNIRPGEELTYDYGKEYADEYITPYGCRCDHPKHGKK